MKFNFQSNEMVSLILRCWSVQTMDRYSIQLNYKTNWFRHETGVCVCVCYKQRYLKAVFPVGLLDESDVSNGGFNQHFIRATKRETILLSLSNNLVKRRRCVFHNNH